jgi:hypothetical protein
MIPEERFERRRFDCRCIKNDTQKYRRREAGASICIAAMRILVVEIKLDALIFHNQ